jgi:hypothetical protein
MPPAYLRVRTFPARREKNPMEFYSVKHRKKVEVPQSDITGQVIERETKSGAMQKRYMLQATTTVDGDKVKLTKFVNEATFNTVSR